MRHCAWEPAAGAPALDTDDIENPRWEGTHWDRAPRKEEGTPGWSCASWRPMGASRDGEGAVGGAGHSPLFDVTQVALRVNADGAASNYYHVVVTRAPGAPQAPPPPAATLPPPPPSPPPTSPSISGRHGACEKAGGLLNADNGWYGDVSDPYVKLSGERRTAASPASAAAARSRCHRVGHTRRRRTARRPLPRPRLWRRPSYGGGPPHYGYGGRRSAAVPAAAAEARQRPCTSTVTRTSSPTFTRAARLAASRRRRPGARPDLDHDETLFRPLDLVIGDARVALRRRRTQQVALTIRGPYRGRPPAPAAQLVVHRQRPHGRVAQAVVVAAMQRELDAGAPNHAGLPLA